MNEIDIFVDFSSHQAMGLSAMEAMACGAAVIVPENGGANCYVHQRENGLIVDTTNAESCWDGLRQLIDDHQLRLRIKNNALNSICDYFPERPAYKILSALFNAR